VHVSLKHQAGGARSRSAGAQAPARTRRVCAAGRALPPPPTRGGADLSHVATLNPKGSHQLVGVLRSSLGELPLAGAAALAAAAKYPHRVGLPTFEWAMPPRKTQGLRRSAQMPAVSVKSCLVPLRPAARYLSPCRRLSAKSSARGLRLRVRRSCALFGIVKEACRVIRLCSETQNASTVADYCGDSGVSLTFSLLHAFIYLGFRYSRSFGSVVSMTPGRRPVVTFRSPLSI